MSQKHHKLVILSEAKELQIPGPNAMNRKKRATFPETLEKAGLVQVLHFVQDDKISSPADIADIYSATPGVVTRRKGRWFFFAVVGVPANNKRWNEMPDEMHLVFKEIESKVWLLRVWYFALPRVVGGTPTTAKLNISRDIEHSAVLFLRGDNTTQGRKHLAWRKGGLSMTKLGYFLSWLSLFNSFS